MKRYLPILAGVAAGAVVIGGVIGIGRMTGGGQDATGYETIRWLNVEIDAPGEDSGLRVTRDVPLTPNDPRYSIRVVEKDVPPPKPGEEEAWLAAHPEVRVDAQTGEVISDGLARSNPQAAALLESLRVVTEQPQVWPYSDASLPAIGSERFGGISFIQPPPASGITIALQISASESIVISNGRSALRVNAATGTVSTWDDVRSEDRIAFERVVAAVSLSEPGTDGEQ